MTATASMANNLRQCQVLVKKAASAGAKALFLPEASDYIAGSPAETLSLVRSVEESQFVTGLQKEAASEGIALHVGVHEPGEDKTKVKNTLLWIDETGRITQRYQKIHLFDLEMKDGPVLRESECALTSPYKTRVTC
jgi:deaminated glutathione amidase